MSPCPKCGYHQVGLNRDCPYCENIYDDAMNEREVIDDE
jgi:uncharacterized OB-fold protein